MISKEGPRVRSAYAQWEAERRQREGDAKSVKLALTHAAYERAHGLPVTDSDRQAAIAEATRRLSSEGPVSADKLDELADIVVAVEMAQTRGELAKLAGVPLEFFGPIEPVREQFLTRMKGHASPVCVALGVLLIIVGGIAQQFGVAILGSVLASGASAVWTWQRARTARV